MLSDLRYAWRSLRRSPASAIAAVVSLAVALGLGTTIAAVVDRTLLAPLPFPDPEMLVVAGEVPIDEPGASPRGVSMATFEAWRARAATAVQLEPYDPVNVTLSSSEQPERLSATAATPGLLRLLGVTPRMGRLFGDAEGPVIVVSDDFWRRHLHADPHPLGKAIVLGGQPHIIVGVLPPAFEFPLNRSSLWLPLMIGDLDGGTRVRLLGRLQPGVSVTSTLALLDERPGATPESTRAAVRPLQTILAGSAQTAMPLLLMAALLAVTLTAANLSGLLMLRTMDRSRELAVRAALGATRGQIARQVLFESHLIVACGTAAGALLALWTAPAAVQLASDSLGATVNTSSNWRAFGALAAMAVACAWLCAAVPAISAVKRRRAIAAGRELASASGRDILVRRALVIGEVTIAFVLVAAMLLVGRSLQRLTSVSPGFDAARVLVARMSLPAPQYRDAAAVSTFYSQLDSALGARLGEGSVAIVDELPLTGDRGRTLAGLARDSASLDAVARVAGPRYFRVLGIPLIDGREFTASDDGRAPARVIVSRRTAERLFGDGRAAGRTLWVHALSGPAEIIGVVADVKHRALDEGDVPTVYFSALQQPSRSNHIVMRTSGDPADALQILRAEARRLDPRLPVYSPGALADVVAASPGVSLRRVVATTFSAFALLAMIIAAVGVFGVVAHDVSRRRLELALRLALGADPRRLQRGIVMQAVAMLAPGVAGGMLVWFALAPGLRAVLYETSLSDPTTFIVVIAVLACCALGAAAIPARQVARTSPFPALRGE
ncbi:MAG TPA: FtsX-like permease family protein [Vicinamibacterales bacterium]|nr:FtsX-like permease family protein [Vicinamibacterales bacterium]